MVTEFTKEEYEREVFKMAYSLVTDAVKEMDSFCDIPISLQYDSNFVCKYIFESFLFDDKRRALIQGCDWMETEDGCMTILYYSKNAGSGLFAEDPRGQDYDKDFTMLMWHMANHALDDDIMCKIEDAAKAYEAHLQLNPVPEETFYGEGWDEELDKEV